MKPADFAKKIDSSNEKKINMSSCIQAFWKCAQDNTPSFVDSCLEGQYDSSQAEKDIKKECEKAYISCMHFNK